VDVNRQATTRRTVAGLAHGDQFHQSVDALGRLEIGILPPKTEDLKRLIDKQKNEVTIPQTDPVGGTRRKSV
jgi:hypothetical protein